MESPVSSVLHHQFQSAISVHSNATAIIRHLNSLLMVIIPAEGHMATKRCKSIPMINSPESNMLRNFPKILIMLLSVPILLALCS